MQLIAVRVGLAAVVAQRLHAGDPDAEINQAFAPWAAKAIGNDDGDGNAGFTFDFATKICGGAIGILWKKHGMLAAIDIGDIDAAVSAEKSMMSFGNQHAVFAAND